RDTEDPAVAIDGGADAMQLLTRVVCGDEMLASILDPFDRPSQSQCCRAHQDVFRVELAANAKPTSDMAFVELDRGRRTAEHPGYLITVPVGDFGGSMELKNVSSPVMPSDSAPGFQRHAGMAPGRKFKGDDVIRRVEGRIKIAVGFADDRRFGEPPRF